MTSQKPPAKSRSPTDRLIKLKPKAGKQNTKAFSLSYTNKTLLITDI